MCKRSSPDKIEANMGCVRETPQKKRKKERKKKASTGCVRETPPIKKSARDV